MSTPYVAERGLHVARPMKEPMFRRALSAWPIFVLAAISIVVSAHVVGCSDDCRYSRGSNEVCD